MNSEEELQELEKKLYAAADKMRGAVPVSSYKFIILGLIFLKYISDAFEERYRQLVENGDGMEEDRDSYTMDNIFYVPAKARWEYLNAHSKDANIGQYIDEALDEIEKENPSLKGVLIKEYNSPDYRNVNLGELIDLFTNIKKDEYNPCIVIDENVDKVIDFSCINLSYLDGNKFKLEKQADKYMELFSYILF